MPQLIPAFIAYAIPATAATAFTIGTTAVTYASLIATTIVAAGSYYAAKSMMSVPNFSSLENQIAGKLNMSRESTPTRRLIYGTQRVSGPIAFAGSYGDKNREIDLILLLADHETYADETYPAGHLGIYFNDVLAIDGQNVVQAPFSSANTAAQYKWGTTNQAAFELQSPDWKTPDSGSRTLSGISALHVHLIHDPQVFPSGLPNISVVVRGKPCLDLRTDTVGYTENPSLILYDYLLNHFGATADELDETSFINAANICDEVVTGSIAEYNTKRYTCNMTAMSSEKPEAIITNILKTCYGKLVYSGQFSIKVGAYEAPTVYLNESDLRGAISVTTRSPVASAYNKVTGLYVDGLTPTSSFQSAEFIPVTQSLYLAEDNGVESVMNIELMGVNNPRIARRLGNLALIDGRQDLVCSLSLKPSGLQLVAGDNVCVSNTRFGWTNKVFEVTNLSINPDLSVDVTCKETSAEIYTWAAAEQDVTSDLSPGTSLQNPFLVDVLANFSASNQVTRDNTGTIFPAIQLDWTSPGSASIAQIELDFKEDIEPNYIALAKLGAGTSTYTTIDVEAGKVYDFRARQYNYFGVYSPYVTASILCVGDNTIPQAPTGSAVAGTGSVALSWVYPAAQEPDYRHTKIVINGVTQGYIAGTTYTKQLSGGGPVTCSLQDFDTSGNGSATSSLIYTVVAPLSSLQTGSAGPTGSKGDYYETYYYRSTLKPSQPSNVRPPGVGWTTQSLEPQGDAVWMVTGQIAGATDTLIGSWTLVSRFGGTATWYVASSSTGSIGQIIGDWVFTTDNRRWWRWSGAAWEDGYTQLHLPDFPTDFKPVTLASSAPTLSGRSEGETYFNTTTGFMYRIQSAAWVLMATSTASLVGQITSTQITDSAITTPKLTANCITANEISASAVTTGKIAATSITTALIAAGALTASHVGTNTLIANTANIASASVIDSHIVSLRAGAITAGTIEAAISITSPTILGGGIYITSPIGIRGNSDAQIITLTGGDDNGVQNGAQLDISGTSHSSKGAAVLQAGYLNTYSSTEGKLILRTGKAGDISGADYGYDNLVMFNSGYINVRRGISFNSTTTTDAVTTMAISNNFGSNDCLAYAGGSGATGVLTTNESHRWMNSGNSSELMALTTGGNLYVQTDVYADAFNSPSSIKYKENVRPLQGAMTIINKLEPSVFDWKDGSKNNDVGLIAEQVAEIIPNVVSYKEGEVNGLDYAKLTPFLIAAIQEQNKLIENMRLRIGVLERR